MGCAASAEPRAEAYSPSGAANKAALRRNQVAPLEDARAVRSVFGSGDPRAAAAPRLSQRVSSSSSSQSSSREKGGSRSGGGVVQSVLKLKTETRTNQYKLVSGTPIGKGFQSKVCAGASSAALPPKP